MKDPAVNGVGAAARRLPRLELTRFTAKSLAANELASRRCRHRTRCHLPALTAFTIRACNRLTWRRSLVQSIADQSAVVSRGPSMTPMAFIVQVTSRVEPFRTFFVIQDQSEVSPLSRQGKARTPIRSITDRHSLSPTSATHSSDGEPLRVTFHDPCGNGWAYHVAHAYHSRRT